MSVEFLHPGFLWLLLAVPPLLVFPRNTTDHGHHLARGLLLVCLVLALAHPAVHRQQAPSHHVVVWDTRAAPEGAKAAQLLSELMSRAPDDATQHLVVVGGGPAPLVEDAAYRPHHVGGPGVSLGTALRRASALVPAGAAASITIVSDGASSERVDARTLMSLVERRIAVHGLDPSARGASVKPAVLALRPTAPLAVGRTSRVHVVLRAPVGTRVPVTLWQENERLAHVMWQMRESLEQVPLEVEPTRAGVVAWRAAAGPDATEARATLIRRVAVEDALRVIYVGHGMRGAAHSLRTLLGRGVSITGVDPAKLDEAALAAGLPGTDVLLLDDVPARLLKPSVQGALVQAVQEHGLGLVVAGGKSAYGSGGYHNAPLAALLPVESVQKEEKRDPSTSLVLIIDTSGSMGGLRVQLAKEVARLAIKRLLPHDKVGIVEFYGAKRWAAPLQPASNMIDIQRALNRLDAGGGTVIMPAIEEAYYGLQNVDTRFKHVLVLTDGGVESGAFEPLLRKMAEKGINTSTVLCGPGAHSDFLVEIAQWGKGRYYNVPDRFNLPEVLLKQPTSSRLPAYREGNHAVQLRGGAGWWGDLRLQTPPPVAGYAETRLRDGATLLMASSQGRHPVVATWRTGRGRVTAWATELTGPGTHAWRAWQPFGQSLLRLMERTARDTRTPYAVWGHREGDTVVVHARARQRRFGAPQAIDPPMGVGLVWQGRAPGQWSTRVPVSRGEDLALVLRAADARDGTTPWIWDRGNDVSPPGQPDPAMALALPALARDTGGGMLSGAGSDTLSPGPARNPHSLLSLRWLCFALALAAYIGELLWRRRP